MKGSKRKQKPAAAAPAPRVAPLDDALLDTAGAARYTGMSKGYLYKDRVSGRVGNHTPGPPYYKVGSVVMYKRSDLDAWMATHRVERGAP